MFGSRPEIEDVFTPRNSHVNRRLYVPRPIQEAELRTALDGSLQPVLYGLSGSGKSWLYRKVLADQGVTEAVVNCSNALRVGSLSAEIRRATSSADDRQLTGVETEVEGEWSAGIVKAAGRTTEAYSVRPDDSLLEAYRALRAQAGKGRAVLVFDNLERIAKKPELMEELATLIILTDDKEYGEYKIKLLIVGEPSDLLGYYSHTDNLVPVSNRLTELTELGGFTPKQVGQLVTVGFVELLKAEVSPHDLGRLKSHVYRITLGVPQMVQEYCELFAINLKRSDWIWHGGLIPETDSHWLKRRLRSSYTIISRLYDHVSFDAVLWKRVLFSLGKIISHAFTPATVGDQLGREFPSSFGVDNSVVERILAEIAAQEPSIIKQLPGGSRFQFVNAQALMCLRLVLQRSDVGEDVHYLAFDLRGPLGEDLGDGGR